MLTIDFNFVHNVMAIQMGKVEQFNFDVRKFIVQLTVSITRNRLIFWSYPWGEQK